ncbi:MAG TPA: hypothetical protein VMB50_09600 [Myxococcales bacterium]|nr:hypothetical protein [Myxococcales bacterium]
MARASERLCSEVRRQVAWLEAALALWPPGEGSREARRDLVRELEHRLGLLALLASAATARA